MKIVFNTPLWVDSVSRTLHYAWNSIKWIVKPPRCEKCGSRMHTRSYEMESKCDSKHERMLVSNLNGKLICESCIEEEILTGGVIKQWSDDKPLRNRRCDCCHEKMPMTYKILNTKWVRLHFCLNWWNGFYVCKQCMLRTVRTGRRQTNISVNSNRIGAYGLHLREGKVVLFKFIK